MPFLRQINSLIYHNLKVIRVVYIIFTVITPDRDWQQQIQNKTSWSPIVTWHWLGTWLYIHMASLLPVSKNLDFMCQTVFHPMGVTVWGQDYEYTAIIIWIMLKLEFAWFNGNFHCCFITFGQQAWIVLMHPLPANWFNEIHYCTIK